MSEPAFKQRQTLDLEEFERRLRGPAPVAASNEDPLAELTRLVEGAERAAALSTRSPHPETAHFAPAVEAPVADPQYHDWNASSEEWSREQAAAHAQTQVPHAQFSELDGDLFQRAAPQDNHPLYSHDLQAHDAPQGSNDDDQQFDDWRNEAQLATVEAKPWWSRKGSLLAGALGVLVLGVGGTWALKGGARGSQDTPTIRAATGPTKIQPENTAIETNTRTASVLDKGGEKLATSRVVGAVEQPIDVAAQARSSRAPGAPSASIFPDPIRVKTISVRPDGTINSPDSPVGSVSNAPINNVPAPQTRSAVASIPTPPVLPAKAALAPKATTKVATRADSPFASDENAPAVKPAAIKPALVKPPAAKPAPKTVQKASVEPVATTSANTAAPTSGGSYAVQMGSAGSDAEAHVKASRIQSKFGASLGGRRAAVQKAEVNGATVYRVRVVGLSQEGATSLCTKLKGEGGDCFVAR